MDGRHPEPNVNNIEAKTLGPRPSWCPHDIWRDACERCSADIGWLYDRNPDAPGDWLAQHAQQIVDGYHAYAVRRFVEES